MLVWLDASVGVADGVLRAADAQRFGDIEAWRQGLLAQRDTMLREAREAAQALREQARREAADIAEAALADAQHAVARGYEEGLRRGILEWHARQAEQVVDRSAMLRRMHEKLATIVTSAVEPAVDGPENAPKRTPVIGRPIACAINWVSIVPDAPTSVPATMSSVLSST